MRRSQRSLLIAVVLVAVGSGSIAFSQSKDQSRGTQDGIAPPLVGAMVTRGEVRFAVLGLAQRIRLEVLSETGGSVFDSDFRRGGVVEWLVQNEHTSIVPDGIYGCVVTVEGLDGTVSQRKGIFRVQGGQALVEGLAAGRAAATKDAQDQFTVLKAPDPAPFTLVSHDGNEGWVESASGGLSLHAGSMSRSRDSVPHMRLTPKGNVGVGVMEPQAKLDVAGTIRASEGFQFSDGTVLKMQGGQPVFVMQTSGGVAANSTSVGGGSADRTTRLFAAAGVTGTTLPASTGPGRVFGLEGGSPYYSTLYGLSAGASLTTGNSNSFFGYYAGNANTTGSGNAFFGNNAGLANTTGDYNSFFGMWAGKSSITTSANSFFGYAAGASNTTGYSNSFFGMSAGFLNSTGTDNSFFGAGAGNLNSAGSFNSFVGAGAGQNNAAAVSNSFVGAAAGESNTTGSYNTIVGALAGKQNTSGAYNSFFGQGAGYSNTTGRDNTFLGWDAGVSNTTENNNSFVGSWSNGVSGITNATVLGYRAQVGQSNSLVLGSINGVNGATADTKVGIGITAPERRLHVAETGVTATRGVTFDQYSADPFAAVFILRKSRNATPGGHAILQNGDALFNFTGQGSDGTKFVDVARIRMEVDGTLPRHNAVRVDSVDFAADGA